jgi:hypothetical protein
LLASKKVTEDELSAIVGLLHRILLHRPSSPPPAPRRPRNSRRCPRQSSPARAA